VGILGSFDQDANALACLAFPQLYTRGIQGLDYTRKRFWLYMSDGLYQSAVIFFVPFLVYGSGAAWSSNGLDTDGLYDFGTTIAAAAVVAASLYVGINTRYWTYIMVLVLSVSTILVYLWIPTYSALASLHYNSEVDVIFSTFFFWATTVLTVFLAVGPRWIVSAIRQSYFPRDKDIIREAWIAGSLKAQLGMRRKRSEPRAEAPSLIAHMQKQLSADDERGQYQRAAMTSPRKEYALSPFASEASTPRNPFSYPPPSPDVNSLHPISPTPGSQATMPASLVLRHHPAPTYLSPINSPTNTLVTPVSQLSYISPTALDAFTLASAEIKRLNRTSTKIKRSSISGPSTENRRSSTISSAHRLSPGSKDQHHPSSVRRRSLPFNGLPRQKDGLSPVRASSDIEPDRNDTNALPVSGSTDFSISSR